MNTTRLALADTEIAWELPSRGRVGMASLIAAEAAIFIIFVVAYLFYAGKSLSGPTPEEVLRTPVFDTICLLSSSVTIHLAIHAVRQGNIRAFRNWWLATVVLGSAFLYGTAREWHRLIFEEGLTIRSNLFGTTFYSLVGLHGFHVIVGLTLLSIVLTFTFLGAVGQEHSSRLDVLSLYWHFVDAVWVVVFAVVYMVAR
jgi:cytochrome c oxidase subunit 3